MSNESAINRYGFLNQKSQTRPQSELSLGVDAVYIHGICQRIESYQHKIEKLEQTTALPTANPNVKPVLTEAISILETCVAKLNEQVPEDVNHLRPGP